MEPLHLITFNDSFLRLFSRLVSDLRRLITRHLTLSNLLTASRVCKEWFVFFNRDDIWRMWLQVNYGLSSLFEGDQDIPLLKAARRELQALYSLNQLSLPPNSIVRTSKRSLVKHNIQLLEMLVAPHPIDEVQSFCDHISLNYNKDKLEKCQSRAHIELLRVLHRHFVVKYVGLSHACANIQHWAPASFASVNSNQFKFSIDLPRLLLCTTTDCGQGGSAFIELLEIGFLASNPSLLCAIVYASKYWGDLSDIRAQTLSLDWTMTLPELVKEITSKLEPQLQEFHAYLWKRGGQQPMNVSYRRLPWVVNPHYVTIRQKGSDMVVTSQLANARDAMKHRLTPLVNQSAQEFLLSSGLALQDRTIENGIVMLDDERTSRMMCEYLDRCVPRREEGAAMEAVKKAKTTKKKPNKFALKSNRNKSSKTPQVALYRATMRAVRLVLQVLVDEWFLCLTDSQIYQEYVNKRLIHRQWETQSDVQVRAPFLAIYTHFISKFLQIALPLRQTNQPIVPLLDTTVPCAYYHNAMQLAPLLCRWLGERTLASIGARRLDEEMKKLEDEMRQVLKEQQIFLVTLESLISFVKTMY